MDQVWDAPCSKFLVSTWGVIPGCGSLAGSAIPLPVQTHKIQLLINPWHHVKIECDEIGLLLS